ncbi:MAG: c-type cytochrome [Burkholderiales bacterium]|nr:c-type cytochrome [Burkholderiales bacterium]
MAAPQRREHPEPHEAARPMPWYLPALTALLLAFGALYIARSPVGDVPARGDGRSVAELQGPAPGATGTPLDAAALYAARCAACHQASGAGLPGVFPPLAGSEWVTGPQRRLAAVVLHGVSGPLTVKGQPYAGAMPAFAAQLQDAELAALLSHLRGQWGNAAAPVSADTVAAVRRDTAARSGPFQGGAELEAFR